MAPKVQRSPGGYTEKQLLRKAIAIISPPMTVNGTPYRFEHSMIQRIQTKTWTIDALKDEAGNIIILLSKWAHELRYIEGYKSYPCSTYKGTNS